MNVPKGPISVTATRSAPTDKVVTYASVHKAIGLMLIGSVKTLMSVNLILEG